MPPVPRFAVAAALVCLVSPFAAGCGSPSQMATRTDYLASGQVPAAEIPAGAAHGSSASASTTIPLAKQNPLTALFQSINVFQSCLQGLGVTFIGVPDKSNPKSPTNDPTYLKSLQTCAAQSNIVQALKDIEKAQNNLTPAQIKKQNKQYLAWRLCMIGKGWVIPMPTPDSNGRLFNIGPNGQTQMKPPPGQTILSSGDMEACANKIQPSGPAGPGG